MKAKRRRGFTLVEIIVVLVILAVLAAILIPSMVRWIDSAQEKAAVTEARQCLIAMQSIAVERYAQKKTYTLADDAAETLALAEVNGTIQAAEVDASAQVTRMVYLSEKGILVTYENGAFTTGGSANSGLDAGTIQSAIGVINGADIASSTINSSGVGIAGSDSEKVDALLKANGIDLSELGATLWQYTKGTEKYGPHLYWSDQPLSGLSANDTIPVMCYTSKTDHYTVYTATLITDRYGKLRIGSVSGPLNTDVSKQTYEDMLACYQAELAKSEG